MESKNTSIAVLGAGLASLSLGYQLCKKGTQILLIEKNKFVGGLAKSIEKDGFIFDLGGHRFHAKNETILKEIKDLLGEDLLICERKSKILLNGKFIDYPLQPLSAIFSFGIWKSVNFLTSYLYSAFRANSKNLPEESFESWIIKRFGYALYKIYFKPYTEKVWGISPKQISKDWATERIDLINLGDAFKKILFKSKNPPKTYLRQFYYPKKGIGMITNRMAKAIMGKGNQILTNWKVSEIRHKSSRIESVLIRNAQECIEIKSDQFVSTIPITELVSMLRPVVPTFISKTVSNLQYKATICVFLIINKKKITDDTWLYFPEKNIIFSRINEPKNWSKECVPNKYKSSLCCQIFCNQNDETWKAEDKKIVSKCVFALSTIGFLNEDEIEDYFVERVPYAYPIYKIGYSSHLKIINDFLSQFKNLHLLGRTGTFSYLNMDRTIEMGFKKAQELFHDR